MVYAVGCGCRMRGQAKADPDAYAKWQKYKKSKDYQIRAQVWGRLGGC
jgi:hypothetical protein